MDAAKSSRFPCEAFLVRLEFRNALSNSSRSEMGGSTRMLFADGEQYLGMTADAALQHPVSGQWRVNWRVPSRVEL